MVTVPVATPDNTPVADPIVATKALELLQVPVPVSVSVVIAPVQIAVVPVICARLRSACATAITDNKIMSTR